MNPASSLNTFQPPQWARVVSPVMWEEYGLNTAGGVMTKTTRGPVIVWATKPGEGEDLALTGPAVSALEVRAAHINMSLHFLAFVWAAYGKVRPSVRWKTGVKVRRVRKLEALDPVRRTAHLLARRAAGLEGIPGWAGPKTAKRKRQMRRFVEAERLEERLRDIAPADWEDEEGNFTNGWDAKDLARLQYFRTCIHAYGPIGPRIWAKQEGLEKALVAFLIVMNDLKALRRVMYWRKSKSLKRAYVAVLNRLLNLGSIYRAHLARRVRPPARRTRIPRPLYATPRPPSASLAPPVI